jgi:acetate kinase
VSQTKAAVADVLAVNIGSSSLKFALYGVTADQHTETAHASGLFEGLEPNGQPRLVVTSGSSKTEQVVVVEAGQTPIQAALAHLKGLIHPLLDGRQLLAVAHRIVHGGGLYDTPVVLNEAHLQELARFNSLAPLHQPHNLAGAQAFMQAFADTPQVACFDTAFHSTQGELETHFGLPLALFEKGIRRYGFHGLSYEYVSGRLAQKTQAATKRLLMAHLGNGSSLCAAINGKSVASTMGFSALDGLIMGTRSGSVDPGVLLHLLEQGQTPAQITKLLYKESGLLGLSGLSADMRTLKQSDDPRSRLAIALYAHRIRRESGALTAVMQGLDCMAFTGGIGEHDADLRANVCARLGHLGLRIDAQANQQANGSETMAIHASNSAVEIWVIPTDEGRVAAESALACLAKPV